MTLDVIAKAQAEAAAPTYTEGYPALVSMDLSGRLRVLATLGAGSASIGTVVLGAGTAEIGKLAAGLAEIGKVALDHINVAGTAMTRPANTTQYAVNDSVSDNGTAGSVTANVVTISDTNDDPVNLTEVMLASTDTGFGATAIRIHLFNSNPTSSSGVVGGDNAAWSNKQAGWIGSMSGLMTTFSDGSRGRLVPDAGSSIIIAPGTGARTIWWQLQTLGTPTPSANSTTFTPTFKGYQGRL